jgi:hypothetical protein
VAPLNPMASVFVPQQTSREQALALANASRRKQLRQVNMSEALIFLRSLDEKDAIDLDADDLKKHNFSEEEFDELLKQLQRILCLFLKRQESRQFVLWKA